VIEMRRLHDVEKLSVAQLSKRFGLTTGPTWCIIIGRTWKHLLRAAPPATGEATQMQMPTG
jgi:hypothetical protein